MKISKIFSHYHNEYYKKIKLVYKLLSLLIILFYFIYHAISGTNGYRSYLIIQKEVQEKQKIYDNLKKEFNIIKTKVDLLSNKSLDLDILEERCRAILNYCYPDDIIIRSKSIYN